VGQFAASLVDRCVDGIMGALGERNVEARPRPTGIAHVFDVWSGPCSPQAAM
jgi:hypothetical protein